MTWKYLSVRGERDEKISWFKSHKSIWKKISGSEIHYFQFVFMIFHQTSNSDYYNSKMKNVSLKIIVLITSFISSLSFWVGNNLVKICKQRIFNFLSIFYILPIIISNRIETIIICTLLDLPSSSSTGTILTQVLKIYSPVQNNPPGFKVTPAVYSTNKKIIFRFLAPKMSPAT